MVGIIEHRVRSTIGIHIRTVVIIIYINDVINVCPEGCSIKMFANDTLIYTKIVRN